MAAICITFIGGASYRWLRHSALRISTFVIAALVITRLLVQSPMNQTGEAWLAVGFLFGLPLIGAFVIGLFIRSRLARAARGGAILLTKNVNRNVDALAEVARTHDDANLRR